MPKFQVPVVLDSLVEEPKLHDEAQLHQQLAISCGVARAPNPAIERALSLRAIGYTRVSTAEQGESGAGLEAQRQTIVREAKHRGWELLAIDSDVASGKATNGRHGLAKALRAMARHDADVLIVAKLDRLSRSVVDFSAFLT